MNHNFEANSFNFDNSQQAWELLNEGFFNDSIDLIELGNAIRNGTELELHDVFIFIRRAWVKPSIDFGNYFGYKPQKWNGLVNNYIDREELDKIKQEVQAKEAKKTKSYNISMHFTNKHGHGKGCLLTLTFSRKYKYDRPILSATMRASELTKRMLLDLLLIQRVGEYVYCKQPVSISLFATKMYQNAESFTMYNNHKPFKDFNNDSKTEWQQKVLKILDKFLTCNIDDIKYKVHKRSVRQLQRTEENEPLSGFHPMLARDLTL